MANALYAKGKQRTLNGLINWETSAIRAALVSNAYVLDLNHEFYSSVAANQVGSPQLLAGKTVTDGVFDANDVTFSAVTSGSTCRAVVLYLDTGVAATSPLLAFLDNITGFPLATSGGDILVQWDNGAFKIFSL